MHCDSACRNINFKMISNNIEFATFNRSENPIVIDFEERHVLLTLSILSPISPFIEWTLLVMIILLCLAW